MSSWLSALRDAVSALGTTGQSPGNSVGTMSSFLWERLDAPPPWEAVLAEGSCAPGASLQPQTPELSTAAPAHHAQALHSLHSDARVGEQLGEGAPGSAHSCIFISVWGSPPGSALLTLVAPVDAGDADLLCGDVLLHKRLPLQPVPQRCLACVPVPTDHNLHCREGRGAHQGPSASTQHPEDPAGNPQAGKTDQD